MSMHRDYLGNRMMLINMYSIIKIIIAEVVALTPVAIIIITVIVLGAMILIFRNVGKTLKKLFKL